MRDRIEQFHAAYCAATGQKTKSPTLVNTLPITEALFKDRPDILKCAFARCVKSDNGCWNYRLDNKYGDIEINGVSYRLHRIVYFLVKGEIPKGYVVMHSCDNRGCINPDHLSAGTVLDNVSDRDRKHRREHPVGIKNGMAKITEEQALEIRNSPLRYLDLQAKFGVTKNVIYRVRKKIHWKHI